MGLNEMASTWSKACKRSLWTGVRLPLAPLAEYAAKMVKEKNVSKIIYTRKVGWYEENNMLKDTRKTEIEFDISTLKPEWQSLFVQHKQGLTNTHILREPELGSFGGVSVKDFVTEQELSLEEAFQIFEQQVARKLELEQVAEQKRKEQQILRDKERAEREATQARIEKERTERAERKFAEAPFFNWDAEGKTLVNLYERLQILSEIEFDTRFSDNWVKRVDLIDDSYDNGFMFKGTWINDRTIELQNEDAVFLVAGTSGSRNYNTTYYRVIVMRDGQLIPTDIQTDNNDAGWALRIREQIRALL